LAISVKSPVYPPNTGHIAASQRTAAQGHKRKSVAYASGRHSGLTPASLRSGHHFSISARWKARRASGVCCSRARISTSGHAPFVAQAAMMELLGIETPIVPSNGLLTLDKQKRDQCATDLERWKFGLGEASEKCRAEFSRIGSQRYLDRAGAR
jgi:hypothetical protein